MRKLLLTTGTLLALSAGGAFAYSPDVTGQTVPSADQPQGAAGGYGTFNSGYLFPNDGSPSSDEYLARPASPQPAQNGTGRFHFSHIYLYPPAESNDGGEG